jgi:hypothetical protein
MALTSSRFGDLKIHIQRQPWVRDRRGRHVDRALGEHTVRRFYREASTAPWAARLLDPCREIIPEALEAGVPQSAVLGLVSVGDLDQQRAAASRRGVAASLMATSRNSARQAPFVSDE